MSTKLAVVDYYVFILHSFSFLSTWKKIKAQKGE